MPPEGSCFTFHKCTLHTMELLLPVYPPLLSKILDDFNISIQVQCDTCNAWVYTKCTSVVIDVQRESFHCLECTNEKKDFVHQPLHSYIRITIKIASIQLASQLTSIILKSDHKQLVSQLAVLCTCRLELICLL